MNKILITGNLTRDPVMRSTPEGLSVCSFVVAVNRRKRGAEAGQTEADFFRVNAWRELGENCGRYLRKGRKVAVTGPVRASAFLDKDTGKARAQMDIEALEVEFLSPRPEDAEPLDDGYEEE